MRPKVDVPPCKFCNRKFQRNEHLHRHERIHTQERPFLCDCGRAFSRRDLLSRHSQLEHASSTRASRRRALRQGKEVAAVNNLNSLRPHSSHDRNHSSDLNSHEGADIGISHSNISHNSQMNRAAELSVTWNDCSRPSAITHPSKEFEPQADPESSHPTVNSDTTIQSRGSMSFEDDLDLLWSDFETSASRLMPSSFVSSYPMDFLAPTQYSFPEFDPCYVYNHPNDHVDASNIPHSHPNHTDRYDNSNDARNVDTRQSLDVMSRYESRLPSMQPEEESHRDPELTGASESSSQLRLRHSSRSPSAALSSHMLGMPWRISKEEYHLITTSVQYNDGILPSDFTFPTRHALCRYIEGFFSGFHEHLPFLHLPTISIASSTPELILAIAAVGARYRFQRKQAYQLYLAARSLLEDRLRRQDKHDRTSRSGTPGLVAEGNFPSLSPFSIRGGQASFRDNSEHVEMSLHQDAPGNCKPDIQVMQAMIILTAMGTWNRGSLLKDALSMASRLALMVREDCLEVSRPDAPQPTWAEWVAIEGQRRTKMIAMCLLNLQSIAYNIPPKLPHSEINRLNLPTPETWWRAENKVAWDAARCKDAYHQVTLQRSYDSLFSLPGNASQVALSSFGNYVLIHCIIQQIFFSRQLLLKPCVDGPLSIPPELLPQLDLALRNWQVNWEMTKDCALDPSAPNGPLSFNSTALFRLAYIRLSANFGPCRQLESRDPASRIARGFRNSPLLERSTYVGKAVLQSAHSLSIPIRIGIDFVARTQALNWSIVHSLCNLECGLFLAKWLETVTSVLKSGDMLRDDEKRLLGIVTSIIGETDLGPEVQNEHDIVKRCQLMAIAVLRLWGYTLKGVHVYDIMGTIGAGLDLCADMLQQEMGVD